MTMITVYCISGVLGLVYSIFLLLFIVKIWQVLEEIIRSGAIPSVLKERARKEAQRMLRNEYVDNPKKLDELRKHLSGREDIPLMSRLDELLKSQTRT